MRRWLGGRMLAVAVALAASLPALPGCLPIGFGIEAVEPPAPPPEPPVPERYAGGAAPALAACEVEGFRNAPQLDPRLYYSDADGRWYRFAMNRWYLAFSWNGNWFPLESEEIPPPLRELIGEMQEIGVEQSREVEKTREEKLRELDEKLRELEEPH